MPTILRSGDAFNVVPAAGELFCDLRADDAEAFDAVLAAVPAEVGGVTLEPSLLRLWPGMDARGPAAGLLAAAGERLGRSDHRDGSRRRERRQPLRLARSR